MYKKLVQMIIEAQNSEDMCAIYGQIDMEYQREKISFKDHEQLFELAAKIERGL